MDSIKVYAIQQNISINETHSLLSQNFIIESNTTLTLEEAVVKVIIDNNLKTRDDINTFCGGHDRQKIYNAVELLCENEWKQMTLFYAKKKTRRIYQKMLNGYAGSN